MDKLDIENYDDERYIQPFYWKLRDSEYGNWGDRGDNAKYWQKWPCQWTKMSAAEMWQKTRKGHKGRLYIGRKEELPW